MHMKLNDAENALKQIIDREGLKYLSTNPFTVYNELLDKKLTNPKTARMILITLMIGVQEQNTQDTSAISAYIQRECYLKKSAADELAGLYFSLFSPDNCREWGNKSEEGFREFCGREWNYHLDSYAVWGDDQVYVEADCHVSVNVTVCSPQILHTSIDPLLTQNPFTTAQTIYEFFEEKLKTKLDNDFDYYVTCEPYYPPVAEDYGVNFEDLITQFCDQYGFQLISWDCEGETSDYISNF